MVRESNSAVLTCCDDEMRKKIIDLWLVFAWKYRNCYHFSKIFWLVTQRLWPPCIFSLFRKYVGKPFSSQDQARMHYIWKTTGFDTSSNKGIMETSTTIPICL